MDFEKKTQNFLAWLPDVGIFMDPGVRICDFRPTRGRGLVALREFEEDELIFSIPRNALLNIATAEKFLDPSVQETIRDMPPWLSLTTLVLAETQNKNSEWLPYLSILPDRLNSLIFWSPEELLELQASAVTRKVGRTASEEIFSKYMPSLGLGNYSNEYCHLVASTVMAYAFDIPGTVSEITDDDTDEKEDDLISDDEEETMLSMVPLADLLNADANKNNARLCCENELLEMRSIKHISAGEEIFNDYGALPQSDLLRRYGYVSDSYSQYDVVEISTKSALSLFLGPEPIQLPSGQLLKPLNLQDFEKRLSVAIRENVYEESYDIYHSGPEGPSIPDDFVALFYIFLLEITHFTTLEASKDNLPGRKKLSAQLVGQALAVILGNREREYATSLEMDKELLNSSDLTDRQLMAVKVRLGEKLILRKSIQDALSFSASNKRMRVTYKRTEEAIL